MQVSKRGLWTPARKHAHRSTVRNNKSNTRRGSQCQIDHMRARYPKSQKGFSLSRHNVVVSLGKGCEMCLHLISCQSGELQILVPHHARLNV